jgi:CheY-like chemotaxis protein
MTTTMVYNVLWVEDDAIFDLSDLTAAVQVALKYKLVIAKNVTEAVERLHKDSIEYDAIIVDIRLPPGNDPRWVKMFTGDRAAIEQQMGNKLGLQFLYALLGRDGDRPVKLDVPAWVSPDRFAVFTVEEESTIKTHLDRMGVQVYQKKRAGLPPRTLRKLIEKIIENRQYSS